MSSRNVDQAMLDMALRENLLAFVQKSFGTVVPGEAYQANWHIEAIAWHLERCLNGDIKRLIINVPPRSLKSHCASVAFPAYILGRDPSARIICVSYGQDLAAKHGRETRSLLESPWYRRVFPETKLDRRKNTETELWTTGHGMRLATSIGGALTGYGGRFIIIDDPLKAEGASSEADRRRVNEFYDETLFSRLDNKNDGCIILVMQRLHMDDLTGHVLDKDDWTVLDIPAMAEDRRVYEIGPDRTYEREPGDILNEGRESRKTLDQIKRSLGSSAFEAQYQQRPVPPGGNLIKREWLQTYDQRRPLEDYHLVVQSWDTASSISQSADYSVCMTWGVFNNTAHLLEVIRVQLEYPDLRRKVLRQADRWAADVVLIEQASSGLQLIQDLRREGKIRPLSFKPRGDKVARIESHTALIEGSYVLLPKEAPWLDELTAELLSFPSGRYDDQVDALSQFLDWLRRHQQIEGVRERRARGERPRRSRRRGSSRQHRSLGSCLVHDPTPFNEW